ncbi:unnamed protein product, partial [Laminaria digitata]
EISPSSSPTLLSPLNCKGHNAFKTLRSACLSAEALATGNDDRPLGQENDGPESYAGGTTTTTTTSCLPPATMPSTGELRRHRRSSAERLPEEDDAQRVGPRAPQNLPLSPVDKNAPGKESPVSPVVGSKWVIRLMVATDHRAA